MTLLRDLGFIPGCIFEVIVSTQGDGGPNAAPMGVTLLSEEEITIRPFKTTRTYRNLMATGCAVLNVTDDPYLFYLATFKDRVGFPEELFEEAEVVSAPRIKGCGAYIEVTVSEIKEGDVRAAITCKVEHVTSSRVMPKAYCRARFAVIESLVHATRVIEFRKVGRDVSDLVSIIDHYRKLVSRVTPGSVYEEIMNGIMEIVGL